MADDTTQITQDTPLDNPTETLNARTQELEKGLNDLEQRSTFDPEAEKLGVTKPSDIPGIDTDTGVSPIVNPTALRTPEGLKLAGFDETLNPQIQGEAGLAAAVAQPPPAKPAVAWRGTTDAPGIADTEAYQKLPVHLQMQALAKYAQQATDYARYKGADPATIDAFRQDFIKSETDKLFPTPPTDPTEYAKATGLGFIDALKSIVPFTEATHAIHQTYDTLRDVFTGKSINQAVKDNSLADVTEIGPKVAEIKNMIGGLQDLAHGKPFRQMIAERYPETQETGPERTRAIASGVFQLAFIAATMKAGAREGVSRSLDTFDADTARANTYRQAGFEQTANATEAGAKADFQASLNKTFYDDLGVKPNASTEEIVKAHRDLAKQLKPLADQGDKVAEQRLQSLNRAREILSDPDLRKVYDQYGLKMTEQEQQARMRQAQRQAEQEARKPKPQPAPEPEPELPQPAPAPKAEEPAAPTTSVHDLRPALRTAEGEIIPGEKGQTHQNIKDAELPNRIDNPDKAISLLEAEHGFVDVNKPQEFLSRVDATAKIPGETQPLQSERLREIQAQTPEGAQNAVPKSSAGSVGEQKPQEVGEAGVQRGGMEQGQQGAEVAPPGQAQKVTAAGGTPETGPQAAAEISPKSAVANPFTLAERPVSDLEKDSEMYGTSRWTHVVDVTEGDSNAAVGKIRGNVTKTGFQIKGANVSTDFQHRGNYRKILLQLADKYGSVTSDPDGLTPTAEEAWKALGAEQQPDGTYKLERKSEQPIQKQSQGGQPAVEKPAAGRPSGTGAERPNREGGTGSAKSTSGPRPLSRNEQGARDKLTRTAHKAVYDNVRAAWLDNPLTASYDVIPSLTRGTVAFVRSTEPDRVYLNPGTFARMAKDNVKQELYLRYAHAIAEHEGIHKIDPLLGFAEQNIAMGQKLMRSNRKELRLFRKLIATKRGPRSLSMELAATVAHIRAGGQHPFYFYQKGQVGASKFDEGMLELANATYPADFEARIATMVDRIRALVNGEAETPQQMKSVADTQDALASQIDENSTQADVERAYPAITRSTQFQTPEAKEALDTSDEPSGIIGALRDEINEGTWNRIKATVMQAMNHTFPRTTIADRVSGEKMARWVSSSIAAPYHAADFIAKVLEGTNIDPNKFGAALTQDNLDSERVAKSLAGNSKAAGAVGNVIGAKGSPFATKEEYLKYLADPAVQDAIQRHIQMWDKVVEPMFKKAMGIDPNTQLPSRGLRTGARINLFIPPDGYTGPIFRSGGGNLRGTMLRRSPFGREATGTGKYGMNYGDMMNNTFSRQEEIANKNDFEKQLISSGNAVVGDIGENPVLEDGEATKGVPYLPSKNLYVRTSLYPEYIRASNVTPSSIPPILKQAVTDPLNRAALAGFTDFVVHLSNIGTGLFTAPGVSIPGSLMADTAATLAGRADAPITIVRAVVKAFQNNKEQLMKLAEIGALRDYHTFGHKYNPLTWSGKVIKWADQTTRLVLDDAYNGLVKQGLVPDTETARREFVNRIGQYNSRAQNPLLRVMRDTGVGPFATAGTTFNAAAIRTATMSPGVKAATPMAAAGLRANMLMKWVGGLALAGMLTYYFTGKFHGRPGVPIGNVDLGRNNANGQPLSIPLFDWLGLGRALRVTGVRGAMEAGRKGLTTADMADAGFRDIWNSSISPFWGPPLRFGSSLANWTPFLGAPAPTPKVAPGESQVKANLVNATIHANPIAGSIQKYRQGAGLYNALESQFPRFTPKASQPEKMMTAYPEIVRKAEAAAFIEGVIQQARYQEPAQRTKTIQNAVKRLAEPQDRLKLMRELKYRRVGF